MGLTGPARSGFFYPRITYAAVTIDFEDPVSAIEIDKVRVQGQNVADSGVLETLLVRVDHVVRLLFDKLEKVRVDDLEALFDTMAGKQVALTLDRFATTGAQWEGKWNTFFSKAELVEPGFAPRRSTLGRALYAVPVLFRQGT